MSNKPMATYTNKPKPRKLSNIQAERNLKVNKVFDFFGTIFVFAFVFFAVYGGFGYLLHYIESLK